MSTSILNSIKKLLGISSTDTNFDVDIIMHINTVFGILHQLGCGPETCFSISDSTSTWSQFLSTDVNLEMVKSYVAMRVRKLFDPPTSSAVMTALDQSIQELEWRISAIVDPGEEEDEDE